MVSFGEAVKRAFSQYCKFTGRASRSEYWWFYLFNLIVSVIIFFAGGGPRIFSDMCHFGGGCYGGFAGGAIGFSGTYTTLSYIWSLAVLLPSMGLLWRRFHDAGHSGWWCLWSLLPVIGWIVLLVAMCQPSVPAANKYGPVPNLR